MTFQTSNSFVSLRLIDSTGAYSNSQSVTLLTRPVVTSIFPTFGPTTGGTLVSLSGNNFVEHETFCRFGSSGVTSAYFESTTSVFCKTPAIATLQNVGLYVFVSNEGNVDTDGHMFSFVNETVPIQPHPKNFYTDSSGDILVSGTM